MGDHILQLQTHPDLKGLAGQSGGAELKNGMKWLQLRRLLNIVKEVDGVLKHRGSRDAPRVEDEKQQRAVHRANGRAAAKKSGYCRIEVVERSI